MKYLLIPLFLTALVLFTPFDTVSAANARYKKMKVTNATEGITGMSSLAKKYGNAPVQRVHSRHDTYCAELYHRTVQEDSKWVTYGEVLVYRGDKHKRTISVRQHETIQISFVNDELLYFKVWTDSNTYTEAVVDCSNFKTIYKNAMRRYNTID